MNTDREQQLQHMMDALARQQPLLPAPAQLQQRVLSRLAQRHWRHLPLVDWPRWAQATVLLVCVLCMVLLQSWNAAWWPVQNALQVVPLWFGLADVLLGVLQALVTQGSFTMWLLLSCVMVGGVLLLAAGVVALHHLMVPALNRY